MNHPEQEPSPARLVAPLLFGSGLCALVYQLTWTREFRLIFGASTGASAAVLAIFVGGLGVGGWWLGRRADASPRPLFLYARLEAIVSISAAITPLLLWVARKAYLGIGGTTTLGSFGGTVVRLLLSALVLAVPTIAMGGTLPAAARAIESAGDASRRRMALLYGVNTMGAVVGSLLANFMMLEVFGARSTLWMACLVNMLVAVFAVRASRELDDVDVAAPEPVPEPKITTETEGALRAPARAGDVAQVRASGEVEGVGDERGDAAGEEGPGVESPAVDGGVSAPFVLGAAAIVGFAFFSMELIWYRMLGPILGGTVFTFGLVLAVALAGIGLGGVSYALLQRDAQPTVVAFAYTCLIEALCIIVPYALGDRIALLALTLREVGRLGFSGYVFCWSVVTMVVVFPAAFVSGVQFPMLIALLGRGRHEVGRQIGLTYAWNTVGALVGSLAGGFAMMPALGARGAWRLVAVLLALLGGAAIALAMRRGRRGALVGPAALLLAVLGLQAAQGPTAIWRHGGIGAGRFTHTIASDNDIDKERNLANQMTTWEREGVESSVALRAQLSLSFIVNGKSDGNAIGDAATQVMAGLLGLIVRPDVRSAMVIGLGTGSTAGWLGVEPGVERVDVVEIEPAIADVARLCAPVNESVMQNPKVHLHYADAREVLQTTPRRYELIFSEPSNPYRAGIASLYTQEFYEAARERLAEDGVFLQWIQGYEISAQTTRTIYATLRSVFPHVDTWVLDPDDMLLVASRTGSPIDVARARQAIAREPLRTALAATWRVNDLEGVLSHFVASDALAEAVARDEGDALNTDDLSPVEFGFARSVGKQQTFSPALLATIARERGAARPETRNGPVDWALVSDRELTRTLGAAKVPVPSPLHTPAQRARIAAYGQYLAGNFAEVLSLWKQQGKQPDDLTEIAIVADSYASLGDDRALPLIERLTAYMPLDARFIRANLLVRQGRRAEGAAELEAAFDLYRTRPWAWATIADRGVVLAGELGLSDPAFTARMLQAFSRPFAVKAHEAPRLEAAIQLSMSLPDRSQCVDHLKPFEPYVKWTEPFLRTRLECYQANQHPLARQAERDLMRYLNQAGMRFDAGLPPPPPRPAGRPDGQRAAPASSVVGPVAPSPAASLAASAGPSTVPVGSAPPAAPVGSAPPAASAR